MGLLRLAVLQWGHLVIGGGVSCHFQRWVGTGRAKTPVVTQPGRCPGTCEGLPQAVAGCELAGEAGRRPGAVLGDSSAGAASPVEGPLVLSSWGTDLDGTLVGVAVQA